MSIHAAMVMKMEGDTVTAVRDFASGEDMLS